MSQSLRFLHITGLLMLFLVGCGHDDNPVVSHSPAHSSLKKWFPAGSVDAESWGYHHNAGLAYIAEKLDSSWMYASFDSLQREVRVQLAGFLMDSLQIAASDTGTFMHYADVIAHWDLSVQTPRDYILNNFDEHGWSSVEEDMIIRTLDAIDSTIALDQVKDSLLSLEQEWLSQSWGVNEGYVAGGVIYTALYSIDYWEVTLANSGLPKTNVPALGAFLLGIGKLDVSAAAGAAALELIENYVKGEAVDWDEVIALAKTGAIFASGAGLFGAGGGAAGGGLVARGWKAIKGWFK